MHFVVSLVEDVITNEASARTLAGGQVIFHSPYVFSITGAMLMSRILMFFEHQSAKHSALASKIFKRHGCQLFTKGGDCMKHALSSFREAEH